MKNYQTEFTIQQLRTKNLVKAVESLSVFVAAVIANMLIPQLLIKYIYDPTKLVVAPPIFEYLPLFTYGLALLYFIFAMVGNFLRERNAKIMEKELSLSFGCTDGHYNGSCCDSDNDKDEISEKELKELEKIVDEALKPTKKTVKKTAKKTVKKTVKKKTK